MRERSFWQIVALATVWPPLRGKITMTISASQDADATHRACYDEGGIIVELDDDETPVRAYGKVSDD